MARANRVEGQIPPSVNEAGVKVDPELVRQLEEAEARDEPVEAVFNLRREDETLPSPEHVSEVTRLVIDRTKEETGLDPEDINVFQSIPSFVVRAKPRFIRFLLDQPEIASAVANRQPTAAKAASDHRKTA